MADGRYGVWSEAAELRISTPEDTVTVLERFTVSEPRTRLALDLLTRLGVSTKVLLVDVRPGENLERAARNLPDVSVVASSRLTARDVIGTGRVVASKDAMEHLARVLGS